MISIVNIRRAPRVMGVETQVADIHIGDGDTDYHWIVGGIPPDLTHEQIQAHLESRETELLRAARQRGMRVSDAEREARAAADTAHAWLEKSEPAAIDLPANPTPAQLLQVIRAQNDALEQLDRHVRRLARIVLAHTSSAAFRSRE